MVYNDYRCEDDSLYNTREWRNWQTRTFEGRVDLPYGFKSRFSHHPKSTCSSECFLFCLAHGWKRNGTVSERSIRYPARENTSPKCFRFLATFHAPKSAYTRECFFFCLALGLAAKQRLQSLLMSQIFRLLCKLCRGKRDGKNR